MKKPHALRAFLAGAVPALQTDPQRLKMFVQGGNVVARSGDTLSFEYRYTVRLVLLDFTDDLDLITVPLLAWLHTYQNELFQNKERAAKAVRFDVEPLADNLIDLAIEVDLTEAVTVTEGRDEQGRQTLTTSHRGETYSPKPYAEGEYTLYLGDKIGAEWHTTQGIG
ncbi:phage tail protein [Comamonas antarctica]|uniref:Phage tail protein n=1 Tax=Comamonas antarctica TaxID=2743470 RepID=A0A6N1WYV4_9BURK|nr:phage tail protein [Comamonas antarctica]QKV52389.1 phage tail protein [Comamonas antarctica]